MKVSIPLGDDAQLQASESAAKPAAKKGPSVASKRKASVSHHLKLKERTLKAKLAEIVDKNAERLIDPTPYKLWAKKEAKAILTQAMKFTNQGSKSTETKLLILQRQYNKGYAEYTKPAKVILSTKKFNAIVKANPDGKVLSTKQALDALVKRLGIKASDLSALITLLKANGQV